MKTGKGAVDGLRVKGALYRPGDVVELPASYKGSAWLEPLEAEPKAVAAPSSVEAPGVEEPVGVPFEPEKPRRVRKAKSVSV